jgi:hypothetical protein
MKRTVLIITGIVLFFLHSACRKEHVTPVNQLVKDLFCFKEGSEWTYYDSISQTTQKMMITKYDDTKIASKPLGGRKAYDFAEYIEINGLFFTDFEVRIRAQGEDTEYDNTASLSGTYESLYGTHLSLPLHFACDKNNNFNCPVTYFDKYDLNNVIYKDVYLFDIEDGIYKKNTLFYVAKHAGLIRMTKIDNFDWILIDKNIQQ